MIPYVRIRYLVLNCSSREEIHPARQGFLYWWKIIETRHAFPSMQIWENNGQSKDQFKHMTFRTDCSDPEVWIFGVLLFKACHLIATCALAEQMQSLEHQWAPK